MTVASGACFTSPTAVILWPSTATSAANGARPLPSKTLTLVIR